MSEEGEEHENVEKLEQHVTLTLKRLNNSSVTINVPITVRSTSSVDNRGREVKCVRTKGKKNFSFLRLFSSLSSPFPTLSIPSCVFVPMYACAEKSRRAKSGRKREKNLISF